MSVYLLDVNVLLALMDPMHIHHDTAHRWFGHSSNRTWATCPITENGFVRIASHSSYPNRPGDVVAVLSLLQQFCATHGHHFWSADVSLRAILEPGAVLTHSQVTDAYLLGLAAYKGGKLATLDQHIPASTVRGGRDALELLPA